MAQRHRPARGPLKFLGLGWGSAGNHWRTPGPNVDYYSPYSMHNSHFMSQQPSSNQHSQPQFEWRQVTPELKGTPDAQGTLQPKNSQQTQPTLQNKSSRRTDPMDRLSSVFKWPSYQNSEITGLNSNIQAITPISPTRGSGESVPNSFRKASFRK